jgi:dihydrofolate reductase
MGVIGTALSMSLDGFIAGQDGRAGGLHDWLTDGETPSRVSPPPYTFVTDGIGRAVERARAMADEKNVHLMGASVVQQSIRVGLLDVLVISLVPYWGAASACWTGWTRAPSALRSYGSSTLPA